MLKKYWYILILPIYMIFYLTCFAYLEATVVDKFHVIHIWIDDYIPFCEFFIVPYFLWFLYICVTVLFFLFQDKTEYYKLIACLFTGMTIFLIVSYIYPNGHQLRPEIFPRDNIFIDMVKQLYKTDTPTNILPSIHVYNSLAAHIAISHNEKLRQNKWIHGISFLLAATITMSTVFLKQHSMLDVILAFIMMRIIYQLVYKTDFAAITARRRAKKAAWYKN